MFPDHIQTCLKTLGISWHNVKSTQFTEIEMFDTVILSYIQKQEHLLNKMIHLTNYAKNRVGISQDPKYKDAFIKLESQLDNIDKSRAVLLDYFDY